MNCNFKKGKQTRKNMLALCYRSYYKLFKSMLNCSAPRTSKRAGMIMLEKLSGLIVFNILLRPLFFRILLLIYSLNLLNCKHRIVFAKKRLQNYLSTENNI